MGFRRDYQLRQVLQIIVTSSIFKQRLFNNKRQMEKHICKHCGSEFYRKKLAYQKVYCSYKCRFLSIASSFTSKDDCWNWPLSINPKTGYGQLRCENPFTGNVEPVGTHRLSYHYLVQEIPDKLLVLHKCDNRRCFNPNHLFVGTHSDNAIDMEMKGRHPHTSSKTHWTKQYPERIKRGIDHHLTKNKECLPKGIKHHNSKLTDDDVRHIRISKESLDVLSKKYGVTKSNICAIRLMKTWKHVNQA